MDKGRMKKRKIGVFLGGKSSEREISIKSGNAILQSLLRSGYHAIDIDVNNDLTERLKRKGIEVAFIALHGKWGEDGTVQGLLEIMGIPYTGSGVLGSSLSMDKAIMKLLFTGMGIPTPAYTILADERKLTFPIPFVVKPVSGGSTIGISIVRKEKGKDDAIKTALKYDKKLLIERYIKGREITVGIVNNIVLPIIEVRPSKGFYDFEAKYTKGMTEYIVPAKINKKIERGAKDIALGVYKTFELSGCVRIDMLMEKDMPQVIDINTSPGMTETSLVPKAWGHMGKTFDELIEEILKGASLKT